METRVSLKYFVNGCSSCEHKFRQGFKDTLNPLCSCSIEAETTAHYFLCCHFYNPNRATHYLISLLLYGDDKFDDTKN